MMYAYKIDIKYEPQLIPYYREVAIPNRLLTLRDIAKHLKEGEEFEFRDAKGGVRLEGQSMYMCIFGSKLETLKEVAERIQKQESYNKKYEEHKLKYGK